MTAYTPSEPEATVADEGRFQTTNLDERGRVQFFFHSPLSELPVRDVTNEQGHGSKTEPYIEKRAENYCAACYQDNNIVPFAESSEKYLFLMTTCKRKDMKQHNKRHIVGYIEKERVLDMGGYYAIQGPTSLYRFEDAYPLSKLDDNPKNIRMLTLNKSQTKRVLRYFEGSDNIYDACLKEVEELKQSDSVPPPEDYQTDSQNSC